MIFSNKQLLGVAVVGGIGVYLGKKKAEKVVEDLNPFNADGAVGAVTNGAGVKIGSKLYDLFHESIYDNVTRG